MKKVCIKYLEKITKEIDQAIPGNDSLFSGELALSFFYYYLYELTEDSTYGNTAIQKLEKVITSINKGTARIHGAYYADGLAGLFYIQILYFKKGVIGVDWIPQIKMMMEELCTVALKAIDDDFNDFTHGSFGILHCLIAYTKIFEEPNVLYPFLKKIEEKYLNTTLPWIPSYVLEKSEKTSINLGLPHGQPGFLILLMNAYQLCGIEPATKSRLKHNIDYVLHFRERDPIGQTANYFPSTIDSITNKYNTSERLAWCYSDLSELILLHKAAHFFEDEYYLTLANQLGALIVQRTTYTATKLNSAQLCHGTGGVAQIYYYLWQQSGTSFYKDAGDLWLAKTLDYLHKELDSAIDNFQRSDLIEGFPGVGLALMSFISDNQLDWSDIILL